MWGRILVAWEPGDSEAEFRELTKMESHSLEGIFKVPLALQKNVTFYH